MMALIAGVLIIGGFLLAALGFSMMDVSDRWSNLLYGTGLFMVILGTGCAAWVLATSIWVEFTT